MMPSDQDLIRQAEQVLRGNDAGGYTRPSPRLYPHQWSWDSAFIAIGLAHLNWSRAVQEINTLLLGQWTDGMVPHIRYNPEITDYAPGPEWWPDVPVRRAGQITSGISQPPVLAAAVYEVGLAQRDERERHRWWSEVFEPLRDALLYFPRHRTVPGSPLIVTVHPWESGLDNSPRWDFAVGRGYRPSRPYRRVDTTVVAAAARPTGRDYDLYMYLVELIAAHRYRLQAYLPETPFAVYDALFNAVWYRSATDLNAIASALGRPRAVDEGAMRAFAAAYQDTLWDGETGLFRDHDLRAGGRIRVDTVAGLVAIYAGLVDGPRARSMLDHYRRRSEGCVMLPSAVPDQPGFDPMKYWRGPVWVNMNWMVVRGLERCGLATEAHALRSATVDLVRRAGFNEYFHARTGEGVGGGDFSWSAALVIDLLLGRRPTMKA